MNIQIIERSEGRLYDIYNNNEKIAFLTIKPDSKTYKIHGDKKVKKLLRKIIPFDYTEETEDVASSSYSIREKKVPDTPSKTGCEHAIVLEPRTRDILKSLSKDVFFMDSKGTKKVGKEFFGRLHINPTDDGHLMLIYDESKVVTGSKDGIDGFEDKATYHTHPYPTYLEFDAKYAWPSVTDYKSIADTIVHGIGVFHIVVTVEGIYVVSLNDEWYDKLDTLKKMVDHSDKKYEIYIRNLDVEYPYLKQNKKTVTPHIKSPYDFCKHANKVKLDKYPVLHTQYIPWTQEMKFKIKSPVIGRSCKL